MTICNARIIAIEATIGNSNALSWDEPSSIPSTESEIAVTLMPISSFASFNNVAMFKLASSNVDSNPDKVGPTFDVSSFNFLSSSEVSSIT